MIYWHIEGALEVYVNLFWSGRVLCMLLWHWVGFPLPCDFTKHSLLCIGLPGCHWLSSLMAEQRDDTCMVLWFSCDLNLFSFRTILYQFLISFVFVFEMSVWIASFAVTMLSFTTLWLSDRARDSQLKVSGTTPIAVNSLEKGISIYVLWLTQPTYNYEYLIGEIIIRSARQWQFDCNTFIESWDGSV